MSSRLYVVPTDHAHDFDTWKGAATFIAPIKSVFGRVLCNTDGSIGYPTHFSAETALEILEQCEPRWSGDAHNVAKVRRWAESGLDLYADWVH